MKIQEIKNQKHDKTGIFRRGHDQNRQNERNEKENFQQIEMENDQVDELDAKYLH